MESTFRDTCPRNLKVIETFAAGPNGVAGWPAHRARMMATCARLGISVNMADVDAAVHGLRCTGPQRVRLTIGLDAGFEITQADMVPTPDIWTVALSPVVVAATDPWFGIKTTNRAIYDDARNSLPDGIGEVIFTNELGHVTEGTITNLFVEKNGVLLTPPLNDGVLPGILRAKMIADGRAEVGHLTWDDMANAAQVYVGNSLRGLIKAAVRR